jgi:hypothetical protein
MSCSDEHQPARARYLRLVPDCRTRYQKDLAVEIIEAEIRSAQQEVLLEAAKLVLSGEPTEIVPPATWPRRTDDPTEGAGSPALRGGPLLHPLT